MFERLKKFNQRINIMIEELKNPSTVASKPGNPVAGLHNTEMEIVVIDKFGEVKARRVVKNEKEIVCYDKN